MILRHIVEVDVRRAEKQNPLAHRRMEAVFLVEQPIVIEFLPQGDETDVGSVVKISDAVNNIHMVGFILVEEIKLI